MSAHYEGVPPDAPQRSMQAWSGDHVSGTPRHTFGTYPDRFGAARRGACRGGAYSGVLGTVWVRRVRHMGVGASDHPGPG